MTRLNKQVIYMLVFMLSLGAASAAADIGGDIEGDRAERSDIQQAQEAFDQGARYYYEEEFSSAIVEFRRAQQMHPHPIFLHNIALSHRELGRVDRARDAAIEARAMDEALPPDLEARNEGLIVGFQAVIDSREISEEIADRVAAAVAEAPDVEPASGGFGGKGWGGLAALGIGAGALAGAFFIDSDLDGRIDSLENDEWESVQEFNDEKNDIGAQQTTGKILLFSGAGLTALGATLVVWELMSGPSSDSDAGMAIAPSIQRPGVEVMLRW